MKNKVFGYPKFNNDGEMVLTTYTNEYSHMNMDIRVYKLKENHIMEVFSDFEETAILLLNGKIEVHIGDDIYYGERRSVFLDKPFAIHFCARNRVELKGSEETEILVLKTKNELEFDLEVYYPEDIEWKDVAYGMYGDVANRKVNTIFDKEISKNSNMVLGEVLNKHGNWSGYLPHSHPQPECYFFKFDHPEGFGASFVGDEVFKSVNYSFSAIPGGFSHPQSCAPCFQMYTCWMIRHNENNPWKQTDRVVEKEYEWLENAKYNPNTNMWEK